MHQAINPEVYRAASLFTDGAITDDVLANVAAMNGLALHVAPAPRTPRSPAVDLAAYDLNIAEARVRDALRAYLSGRRGIAAGNKFRAGHRVRSLAFAQLNRRRRELARDERALAAARVALDAACIAAELDGAAFPLAAE